MPAYCRNCGTKLSPKARFCKHCGLQLGSIDNPPKRGRFLVIPVLLGGLGLVLCLGMVTGGVLLFRQILLGREAVAVIENVPESVSEAEDDADIGYVPGQPAPAETSPESKTGTTSAVPTTLILSDGTQVDLPGSPHPATVVLSRESNSITLADKPDLQTSGSMRVLEFDLAETGENFIPRLTIPAPELGSLDLATTNVVRVGQFVVNGETLPDDVAYLPVERDAAGNLVVVDGLIPTIEDAAGMSAGGASAHMASLNRQRSKNSRVSYVLMTFQNHLEWSYEPQLVRMIPDASAPEYRRPADTDKDKELLQKPVVNVIVLVHGHNEEEKDGSSLAGSEIQPWGVSYKRDVWNEFYRTYLDQKKDALDCTAFYEYIYPTYRPAYSPVAGSPVEPLGYSFAQAMAEGAKNDDKQLGKILQAKMPVNLYILAHSMGGLVARAGIREFNEPLKQDFQQLVTWGTPHHGSPLVSMGYLFRAGYKVNYGKLREARWFPSWVKEGEVDLLLGSDLLQWLLDLKLQLDTPGTRDLRWDNVRPLRLDP